MSPQPAADRLAIEQLKYRYLRTLDTLDWEAFATCSSLRPPVTTPA